jgi:transcriptional antiterminator NusG
MMMVTESSLPTLDEGLSAEGLPLELPAPAVEGAAAEAPEKPQVARWYAVQVASSCEKKVKATLEQRAVTLGVDNRILEIEIPG